MHKIFPLPILLAFTCNVFAAKYNGTVYTYSDTIPQITTPKITPPQIIAPKITPPQVTTPQVHAPQKKGAPEKTRPIS